MSGRLLQIPQPIEWHDGMLLAPGHFDDLTMRLEGLLEQASILSAPFNWGVASLDISEGELIDGVFAINQMEATLPDGFPVWHEAQNGTRLDVDLKTLDAEIKGVPFTIYAVVPASRPGAGRLLRFESQGGAVATASDTAKVFRSPGCVRGCN